MNDLISRKRVLKAIEKLHVYGFATLDEDKVIETINNLPSVTPKEKTGKWREDANKIDAQFGRHTYICSECGKYAEYFISGTEVWWDRIKPNFCPNCGARMVEPQESEKKQEQTRDEKMIDAIGFAIKATDSQDDYSMGMRNGMRYVKSLIDGKEPQYEFRRTNEEIKLGIDLGDEVIGDYGAKGVVVGMDTYKGDVLLSLLMRKHKVPQLVKASGYKTKTGRHFPQIIEVLEQIKGHERRKRKSLL